MRAELNGTKCATSLGTELAELPFDYTLQVYKPERCLRGMKEQDQEGTFLARCALAIKSSYTVTYPQLRRSPSPTIMYLTSALAGFALVSGVLAHECNANNCARAVTGTRAGKTPGVASRMADCSSFMMVTVTPAVSYVPLTPVLVPT
jgi:hypothetical protein